MQASESRHRFWLLFLKLKLERSLAGYKYATFRSTNAYFTHCGKQYQSSRRSALWRTARQHCARVFYCICGYRITRTSLSLFSSLSYSTCFSKGNNFYISAFVAKSYLHHPLAFIGCSKSLNFSSTSVQGN